MIEICIDYKGILNDKKLLSRLRHHENEFYLPFTYHYWS